MPDGRVRADAAVYAQRINAAAELLETGVPVAEAAAILADRFDCSARQARRYADRAAEGGRAVVPEETTVFTVKLPAALAVRVREHAKESGSTISALVARALAEFLARSRRTARRR
ncbi:ribbon-helix-helix protein, CopG family [Rhodococcus sp. 2H158]